MLRQVRQALFLGQVLANEPVGVFVGAAFPRMVRRREVKAGAGRLLDHGVGMEFRSVVGGDRPDRTGLAPNQLGRAPTQFATDFVEKLCFQQVAFHNLAWLEALGGAKADFDHDAFPSVKAAGYSAFFRFYTDRERKPKRSDPLDLACRTWILWRLRRTRRQSSGNGLPRWIPSSTISKLLR